MDAMFKGVSRKVIISVVILIVVLLGVLGMKNYNKSKDYKNLVTTANEYMNEKDYDKAMNKFKESLDYKKDQKAEEKLEECKNELINLSKEALKNKEYEKADNYLNVLLKHDGKNEEAIKMKNTIKDEIQKSKEEEEIKKAIEKEKREQELKKQMDKEEQAKKKTGITEQNKKKEVKENNKITKEKAESLVQPLKNKNEEIRYLGTRQVPEIPAKSTPYKKFPKEIENKKVYIFDIAVVYNSDSKATIGRYYVDFSGNIYKDTYPSNLECVKVK
ncbi:hypothetical protein DP145_13670 [Clostridium tetani]|nr:hypothetical protein DP126_10135 [Clostridium tetani]RXI49187.1 hypothetical protein DP124_13320 [Clostridium tetani]RXI49598.1 hypothetical protein DP122_13695 [Clostridium tetani]RXI68633.1 hypothetical protein DP127_12420 [Clostridium tetani]RXM57056.1 hypothetical protein DP133_12025 [Clostridium tetani]